MLILFHKTLHMAVLAANAEAFQQNTAIMVIVRAIYVTKVAWKSLCVEIPLSMLYIFLHACTPRQIDRDVSSDRCEVELDMYMSFLNAVLLAFIFAVIFFYSLLIFLSQLPPLDFFFLFELALKEFL